MSTLSSWGYLDGTAEIPEQVHRGPGRCGEANSQAKVTLDQVLAIYNEPKSLNAKQVQERHPTVSESCIYSIRTGRSWGSITGATRQ